MHPLRFIDGQLNGITMYRLVVYGLLGITGASLALSLLGVLGFTSISLLVLLGLLLIVCLPLNYILSKLYQVPFTLEPSLITALILYMILSPVDTMQHALVAIIAGAVAIGSKYVLTARGRHIFNPAALGLAVVVITGLSSSMWWVGSIYMLPFTLIVGLLVVRKIRRFAAVGTFVLVALILLVITGMIDGRSLSSILGLALVSGPLVFAASIMLTEPATMPAGHRQRLIYASIVGIVYASHISLGPISATPEVALLVGNLYALAVTPASRMTLRLVRKNQLSQNIYDFEFTDVSGAKHAFKAGQYAELTLPVPRVDNRGNRRTFTIASAPSEDHVHFGVKFYQPSSRFKQALVALEPGAIVHANHINGDFTLPHDAGQKLAFIAGGIGITPFRSHIAELIDKNEKRDVVLFYLASNKDELSYDDLLRTAERTIGLRVVRLVADGKRNLLDSRRISKNVPDYAGRQFYISGPNQMVDATAETLWQLGVTRRAIKTDHFSGY